MNNNVQHLGQYWDSIADIYNDAVSITTKDFHYGPLVPGDSDLGLLPAQLNGARCLEIGAGAGHNSIFLAKAGASCLATDISNKQLDHGRKIAASEKVEVEFSCIAMEELSLAKHGSFDLIHSSYAITFSLEPGKVIGNWAEMLKPGGTLIISTGHPLFTGEWLNLDDEQGLFLTNYFQPQPDIRYDENDEERVRSNFHSISTMSEWFYNAGLVVERILEPEPINIDAIPKAQRTSQVPYYSNGWAEYHEQLKSIPGLIIFKCRKL